MTQQLVQELVSAGLGVVSGLAYGIDKQAHITALDNDGYTVAVLGTPIDDVRPVRNREVAQRILEQEGALVSEYAPGTATQKFMFIERNRIIAGLCKGVIVIEADSKSGSLTTARFALEANRSVMAMPGHTTSELSSGTNALIRSGAALVRHGIDVLDELNIGYTKVSSSKPSVSSLGGDTPEEKLIRRLISQGIYDSQQLIERSKLSAAEFAQVITLMEISGKVRDGGNGTWTLA